MQKKQEKMMNQAETEYYFQINFQQYFESWVNQITKNYAILCQCLTCGKSLLLQSFQILIEHTLACKAQLLEAPIKQIQEYIVPNAHFNEIMYQKQTQDFQHQRMYLSKKLAKIEEYVTFQHLEEINLNEDFQSEIDICELKSTKKFQQQTGEETLESLEQQIRLQTKYSSDQTNRLISYIKSGTKNDKREEQFESKIQKEQLQPIVAEYKQLYLQQQKLQQDNKFYASLRPKKIEKCTKQEKVQRIARLIKYNNILEADLMKQIELISFLKTKPQLVIMCKADFQFRLSIIKKENQKLFVQLLSLYLTCADAVDLHQISCQMVFDNNFSYMPLSNLQKNVQRIREFSLNLEDKILILTALQGFRDEYPKQEFTTLALGDSPQDIKNSLDVLKGKQITKFTLKDIQLSGICEVINKGMEMSEIEKFFGIDDIKMLNLSYCYKHQSMTESWENARNKFSCPD